MRDCEVARLREKYFFAPVAERGTSSARQWTVCRAPLITDKLLPGAPFFQDCKIARLREVERAAPFDMLLIAHYSFQLLTLNY